MPSAQELIQARWLRRAFSLALVGLAWHVLEAGASWYLGVRLNSPSLRGFALDSLVELIAGIILVVRIRGNRFLSEQKASRLIAVSFVVVSVYIIGDSLWALLHPEQVDLWRDDNNLSAAGWAGLGLAAASIVCMYPLAWAKTHVAKQLHSDAARAEGRQTWLCAHMAWLLLGGLLFSRLGLPWADPLAALGIAGIALREAKSSWRGDDCGCAIHVHPDMQYPALLKTAQIWTEHVSYRVLRWWQARWLLVVLAGYTLGAALYSGRTILWLVGSLLVVSSMIAWGLPLSKRRDWETEIVGLN